jgi:predicted O-methyltransferase YrrM
MALHYQCNKDILQEAVNRLKKSGKVAQDAFFNEAAVNGLRREISYRDMDLLEHLGYCKEEQIVSEALKFLKELNLIKQSDSYDLDAFLRLRMEVKKKFNGDWGTITPTLERLLYAFTSTRKPKRIAAIGIFWGNAFIWNVGSTCGTGKVYDADYVYGVDLNPKATEKAEANIRSLENSDHIHIINKEGVEFIKESQLTFDYLYLDVGISQIEKSLNYNMIKAIYDKLEKGAWVVTHDTTHPYFYDSFKKYLQFVRDKEYFSESICFDFDPYGLEVSIKK